MTASIFCLRNGLSSDFSSAQDGLGALQERLIQIGLIKERDALEKYEDLFSWRRGGAETFVAAAKITTSSKTIFCLGKAFITLGSLPERRVEIINERRNVFQNLNIPVPQLYGVNRGTLYEEYIDEDLSSNLSKISDNCLRMIGKVGALLDKHGYRPSNFLQDMRYSESKDSVYYVDFGSDLGEPSTTPTSNCLEKIRVSFHKEALREIEEAYQQATETFS